MKTSFLPLLFCLLGLSRIAAQDGVYKYDLSPCGTPPNAFEDNSVQQMLNFSRSMDTVLYVPLTIHLVATDGGTGRFPVVKMLESFCQLNKDFELAKIQFYIAGDLKLENNSSWYSHDSIIQGAKMMFANNVANTINVYFCSKAAGNCGYNLPYGGVAIAKSCAGSDSHTWAHELGHALRLPHPFLGWEGKIYSNATYALPTPKIVTYDYTQFKDSLLTDTLVIDTAFVELVDMTNCATAADQICDTKADYLAFRWQCNATTKKSFQIQKDTNNIDFYSDGTLFMSYSFDECQSRFSDGQIATMRNHLYGPKAYLLANQVVPPPVSLLPIQLLLPIDSSVVALSNSADFAWQPVAGATSYTLQVSRVQDNFNIYTEYVVNGTTKTVTGLQANRPYFWRVKPFNSHFFCAPSSPKKLFRTAVATATNDLAGIEKLQIFPMPVPAGEVLRVALYAAQSAPLTFCFYDLNGRLLFKKDENVTIGEQTINLPIQNLHSGIYFLGIETNSGRVFRKVVVQ